ncbi:hypothetical protein PGTUg99_026754 [Puccinia graminis f. sp. tritici]|uniref:Uncharacterized protein n=1 Tax=Puccinia graminis f. sp. tritici TaxID=56615 RepID=A0A5B0RZ79_PUCGR|nr:hypothetical protein PGTUg99_026754 [Puccinia graminis f. sp. tritici]
MYHWCLLFGTSPADAHLATDTVSPRRSLLLPNAQTDADVLTEGEKGRHSLYLHVKTSSPASGFSLALTSYDGRRRIVSINPDSVAGCRSRDVDAWDRNPPWLLSIPCAS